MADIALPSPGQDPSSRSAAETRQEVQESLQRTLDLMPDAVVFLDRDWNFTFANRQAMTLLGSVPLIGVNVWELFPHNRLEPFQSSYRTTMEQRIPTEFEAFYPEPLHSWYRVFARPHDDGICIIFSDVTMQKAAEERSDEARQRLAEVFAATADAILCVGPDWKCTYANARAQELLGDRAIAGTDLWTRFPGNQEEPFASHFRRAMQERAVAEFEARSADPLDRWLHVVVRPFHDGIVIASSDITARKLAELERDRAAGALRQVLDVTNDVILALDRDWRVTLVNRRGGELLSPAGEILGRNLWELFPGATAAGSPYRTHCHRAMDERIPSSFEALYPAPLNLWFKIEALPSIDGIVLFFRNITEDRNRIRELQQQTELLTTVQQAALVATWELDLETGAMLYGAGSYPVFGRPFHELPTMASIERWIAEPSLASVRQNMERAITTGQAMSNEFALHAADGEVLWIESRGQVLYRDGRATHLGGISMDVTARKRNEDQLRLSETRYRVLTELNPQLIFTSDAEGRINFANQRLLQYLGLTALETDGGSSWEGALHPDDRGPLIAAWRQSVESGGEFCAQARVCRAEDGAYRWLDISGLPIHSSTGAVGGWLGIGTDVHERKLAIEALAASEMQFRVLTDLNPQFIWMGSADGRVRYANQRFLGYIGKQHTPDDTGRWIEAFDPEDRERVVNCWTRSVATGEDYGIEARLIRDEDQASRWFHVRAQPLRNEAGAIQSWLGVAIDIHESRTFAETLRAQQIESERQRAELESVYQNTPIGLALFDPVEFRYLRINDELARTIGLPKEQILGRSVLEVVPGVATIGELFRQVATGKPVRNRIVEGEQVGQPGVLRSWNVNYFPIRDSSGTITGITTASLEITQQRQAEAALIQSEKLAAVGRLASSISHEINNPLEAITNLLYLVAQAGDLPQELRVYVHMAQSELQRVSQIATQTLRFHRQAVGATLVNAKQLVNAVLNLYQGRLANSGIEVSAIYGSSTEILCFENDIRQVLNNLIANAIDAMRTGGRLVVRAHEATDAESGRAGVRIAIADTGHGMSRTTQRRLFEPFYTTKGLNGTGLGLWISSEIVKRHEGRLRVRSSQHPVHHGTVFTLFLPLRESAEPGSPAEAQSGLLA